MDIFQRVLGDISGGRVLDVATGEGGFVQVLRENLKRYSEIIGIDVGQDVIDAARGSSDHENIRFLRMDAERLGFRDQCFDTVNVSASLHHLANVPQVLAGMKRVLRPGGRFIVSEMHRDGQTEAQLAAVRIHHWAAEVDSAFGVVHNKTFARQQFVDWIKDLDLCSVTFHDFSDTDSDPMDEATIEGVGGYIDRFIQRAERLSSYETLKQRGERLRARLREVGVQREPVLIIVGEK